MAAKSCGHRNEKPEYLMKYVLLSLILWGCSSLLHASGLEVMPLKHQSAAEIIPLIKPLLDSNEVVTGTGYKLIVRATPQRLSEIRMLLDQVDVPVQHLVIRVRQHRNIEFNGDSRSVAGKIGEDDARIKFGRPVRRPPGLSIEYRDEDNRLQANVIDTRRNAQDSIDQQVRTLSGQPAYISTGQSTPIPRYHTVIQGNRVYRPATTDYQHSASGFYVIPRLQGDRVHIEIHTQRETPGRHRFQLDTSSLVTTVSGKLGQWITLGQTDGSARNTNTGMYYRQQHNINDLRDISILITVAR